MEPLEARDEEEGNPESSMHKNDQYKQERKEGPRWVCFCASVGVAERSLPKCMGLNPGHSLRGRLSIHLE